MPIYEYRRPDGTTFEIMQRMSEDALTHDPETGVPVQRVLFAPAVHFKGSGFYNTDYGTSKRKREEAASKASDSGSSTSSESSSKANGSGAESSSSSKSSDSGSSGSSSTSSSSDGSSKSGSSTSAAD